MTPEPETPQPPPSSPGKPGLVIGAGIVLIALLLFFSLHDRFGSSGGPGSENRSSLPGEKWAIDAKNHARSLEGDAVHDTEKVKREMSEKVESLEADIKKHEDAFKEDVKLDVNNIETGAEEDWDDVKNDLDKKTAKIKKEFEKIEADTVNDVKHGATVITDDLYQAVLDLMKDSADENRPVPAEDLTVTPIESALPAHSLPLAIKGFPDRPKPLIELGDPFFGSGYIDPGFRSFTGAMWQPQFIVFGDMRTAVQTFNTTSDVRTSEWVNRLDLYSNLALTPTERFLLHWQPLNRNTTYSGYQFEPDSGGVNGFFGNIDELYFEGNLLSMFPSLDDYKHNWLSVDMTVGRQIINLQDGILLNDNIDMIGLTHPSLFTFGSSAATVTGFAAWNNISRGDNQISNSAKMFGGILRTDYSFSTLEIDGIYVSDTQSDGAYLSASAIQRLGPVSTAFRVNQSFALGDSSAAVATGTLLFAQLSMAPPGSEDQIYLNTFWGIKSYTSAGRSADAGRPLGQTGILFASPGIGSYQGVLGGNPQDDFGGALGYQMFIDGHRKQIVFETGFLQNTVGRSNNTVGLGIQYQQAIGQRWVWIVGSDVGFSQQDNTAYGARTEIQIKF